MDRFRSVVDNQIKNIRVKEKNIVSLHRLVIAAIAALCTCILEWIEHHKQEKECRSRRQWVLKVVALLSLFMVSLKCCNASRFPRGMIFMKCG